MTFYLQPYPARRITRRLASQPQERALGVNIREEDDAYILSALVPGLKAEDLNIQVLEDVVSIEGEYRSGQEEYLLNELPSGSFRRSLRLPAPIQADKIEVKISDGVLTLRLPRAESARLLSLNQAV